MSERHWKRTSLATLILSTLGFGTLLATYWIFLVLASPMAFDAGVTPDMVVFVFLILSFPVLYVGSCLAAWVSFGFRAYRTATAVCLMPLVNVLMVFAMALLDP